MAGVFFVPKIPRFTTISLNSLFRDCFLFFPLILCFPETITAPCRGILTKADHSHQSSINHASPGGRKFSKRACTMPKKDGLTPKQAVFVQEYLIDLNATQAAIRAGYSAKTANRIGEQNLSKIDIQKAIAKSQAERSEKTGRTALDVLNDIYATAKEAREQGDLKTALKGYELEGRHYGLFDRKIPDSGPDEAPSLIKDILEAFK